jgi:hypothetical protein
MQQTPPSDTQPAPNAHPQTASLLAAAPVVLQDLPEEKQTELIEQLAFPFGSNKPDPAMHIIPIAVGMQRVYKAVATAFDVNGPLTEKLAVKVKECMPEVSDSVAMDTARSYSINRRDEALSTVALLDPNGPLVTEAVAMSEAGRRGEAQPQLGKMHSQIMGVATKEAGKPVSFEHMPYYVKTEPYTTLPEWKHDELAAQMELTYPGFKQNGALITLAKANGQIAIHKAIANAFEPGGEISQQLAQVLSKELGDVPPEAAQQAADGYCLKRRDAAMRVTYAFGYDQPLVQDAMQGFKEKHESVGNPIANQTGCAPAQHSQPDKEKEDSHLQADSVIAAGTSRLFEPLRALLPQRLF